MVRVIDLDENGLTTQQVLDSVQSPGGAILRREGRVIGHLGPADQTDLEDEAWARAPEQVERGEDARERHRRGESIPAEEVRRRLGLDKNR